MDVKCGVMKIPISLKKYIQSSVNSSLVYQNFPIICQYSRIWRARTLPTINHYKTENDLLLDYIEK